MKTVLLVDADIVAFKFAAKGQRKTTFGVAVDDLSVVTAMLDQYVQEQKDELGTDLAIICLSCPSAECWRKDILPSYKDNRDESSRPVHLAAAKQHLADAYPSYRKPTLEADDVMGILSTMDGLPRNFVKAHPEFAGPVKKIIFSEDKDMKTIPGWLYNPAKDSRPRLIGQQEAGYWHLYQTLVGDTTDGYKGLPKCGPVNAALVLQYPRWPDKGWLEFAWGRLLDAYKAKGLVLADALVQAQVARICHASDYDFTKGKVIPWIPPSNPSTPATAPTVSTTSSVQPASSAITRKGRKTAAK